MMINTESECDLIFPEDKQDKKENKCRNIEGTLSHYSLSSSTSAGNGFSSFSQITSPHLVIDKSADAAGMFLSKHIEHGSRESRLRNEARAWQS